MTWEVDISEFEAYAREIESGEPIVRAINAGVNVIAASLDIPVFTGKTEEAFSEVKYATSKNDSGGVGSMEKVGDPFQPAPEHTISEFLKWYRGENA